MNASPDIRLPRTTASRIVVASFIGSTVEWFEFFACAVASALACSPQSPSPAAASRLQWPISRLN